jgi:hypothetical protein
MYLPMELSTIASWTNLSLILYLKPIPDLASTMGLGECTMSGLD